MKIKYTSQFKRTTQTLSNACGSLSLIVNYKCNSGQNYLVLINFKIIVGVLNEDIEASVITTEREIIRSDIRLIGECSGSLHMHKRYY